MSKFIVTINFTREMDVNDDIGADKLKEILENEPRLFFFFSDKKEEKEKLKINIKVDKATPK